MYFSIYILGNIRKIAECSEIPRPADSTRPSPSEGEKVSFQLAWILILVFLKCFKYVVLALLVIPFPICLWFLKHIFRLFPYDLSNIYMGISGWEVLPVVHTCGVLTSHLYNRENPPISPALQSVFSLFTAI